MQIITTITVPKLEGNGVRVLTIGRNDRGRFCVSWETVHTILGKPCGLTRVCQLDHLPADHAYRIAAETKLVELFDDYMAEQARL